MGRNQTLWTDVRLATHNCSYLSSASPVRVKQYPISRDAKAGPRKHFCHLREAGILVSCPSSWNSPLLPVVKTGTKDGRPAQDLREVNKRGETIPQAVPNPYTLLSLQDPGKTAYTVLDLKEAFFSLPSAPVSQPIFTLHRLCGGF